MPYPTPVIANRDVRHDAAAVLGDRRQLTTTSAGNAGGTTAVFSSLIGAPPASVINKYLLIESGTNENQFRVINAFAPATGTVTLRYATTTQIATAVTCYLHEYNPQLYKLGLAEAIRDGFHALYRPILHHAFVRVAGQRTLPFPGDMKKLMRVFEDVRSSNVITDYFDRTDSTGNPGTLWTPVTGTWGITGGSLYCSSATDGDLILAATNPHLANGVIQALVRGDTTVSNHRVLSLVFRYQDAQNYLRVRLRAGILDLGKVDHGVETTLHLLTLPSGTTEDVDYLLRVMFDGQWISIWVDDVQQRLFDLTGGQNLKFLGQTETGTETYGNVGVRLDTTGSPSLGVTATRLDDYHAHALTGRYERGDWQEGFDRRGVEFNTRGRGVELSPDRMIWMEGMTELTQPSPDTDPDFSYLDATVALEILTTDPAYEVLVQMTAAVVLREMAMSAFTDSPEKRAEYAARAQEQMQRAARVRARNAMPWQPRRWG